MPALAPAPAPAPLLASPPPAQVENQLLGAPFSLPLLLATRLLPSAWRAHAPSITLHTAAVLPMDGNPPPGGPGLGLGREHPAAPDWP